MRWSNLTLLLFLPSAMLLAQTGSGLPAPTGVDASDGAYSTKVGVCWDHVRDAKLYRILRSITNSPASAVSVGTTPSLIFYDSTAEPQQTYYYWVQAENGNLKSRLSASDQGFRANGVNNVEGLRIPPLAPPPAPAGNPVTGAKVYLGKALFWEEQLSSTRTVACGTCHRPRNGGSDPRSMAGSPRSRHPGADGVLGTDDDVIGSPGVPVNHADGSYEPSPLVGFREQVTRRKAQSAIDAGYSNELFWDGRAGQQLIDPLTGTVIIERGAALESQALEPFVEPVEMIHEGGDWENVVARLAASNPLALSPSIPPALAAWIGGRGYPELFAEAFGTPEITPVRIAMAVATYERTLYSDRTAFDAAVSAIKDLPPEQKRGRDVFRDAFCDECHRGSLTSDNRFHYIGLRPVEEDEGRFEANGELKDLGRFRAPSMRNVALRAPYMHDGRFAMLEEVIEFYDRGGDFTAPHKNPNFIKPLHLTSEQKSDLIAFLKDALTDPRVEAEAGPIFDRPMLYSESARVPRIVGAGSSGAGGPIPQVIAIEPPFAGNPSFTVGLSGAPGGARAVLVMGEADPGPGPAIPASASFFRIEVAVSGEGAGNGYASVSLPIPNDPSLIGSTLFGRWFVIGETGGVSATPAFRMTIFGPPDPAPAASPLATVSAASLALGLVATESLVTAFGENLSAATESAASLSLPTFLAGISVLVKDSMGSERLAPLTYVSPSQINYLIPPGTAPGEASVSVLRGGAVVAAGAAQVAVLAPALFSANADGLGVAAALAFRVKPDGSEIYEPVAHFDAAQNRFVSTPIDLGPDSEQVFLTLYGTGIRFRNPGAPVTATIGAVPVDVLYAGPQGEFAGLDQINLALPRSLAGRGEVDIAILIDGEACNTVRVSVL